jgi:hypothetical protein
VETECCPSNANPPQLGHQSRDLPHPHRRWQDRSVAAAVGPHPVTRNRPVPSRSPAPAATDRNHQPTRVTSTWQIASFASSHETRTIGAAVDGKRRSERPSRVVRAQPLGPGGRPVAHHQPDGSRACGRSSRTPIGVGPPGATNARSRPTAHHFGQRATATTNAPAVETECCPSNTNPPQPRDRSGDHRVPRSTRDRDRGGQHRSVAAAVGRPR